MHTVVIGAGIVGLSSAYALARDGQRVTVIDALPGPGQATSYANGAQLSYSFVAPLAEPGVLGKLITYWVLSMLSFLLVVLLAEYFWGIWLKGAMGELMLLYGIADLAFVGGSLVERGGHNPLEPAAHAIPVLMGPHTFNFKDICAKLQQDDGLITVTDADSLVREVSTLLTDEDYRLWYGRHAVEVLHQNQGALSRLLQLLQPYLPQRSH